MSGSMIRIALLSSAVCIGATGAMAQSAALQPASPPATTAATASAAHTVDARAWPRSYNADGVEFSIFQPQVDSWEGNVIKARAVMAVKTGETKGADGKAVAQQSYGVLWLSARTETDKGAREVVLDQLTVEKANFPDATGKDAAYLAAAKKALPTTSFVASLDMIEASLAITDARLDTRTHAVSNTPPDIIVSLAPAVLVQVDGEPVWRPSGTPGVDRVLNSRVPILRYNGAFYVGRSGKWATSKSLASGWAKTDGPPAPVAQALAALVDKEKSGADDKRQLPEYASFPEIYVRTKPTELLIVDGDPNFADIEGTGLSYVVNTPADLFLDNGNNWYVLVSGRWFRAGSTQGPWTYVAPDALPADFRKIPSDGPKGAVLASIAGTPEAKESLVANSVPQTATVSRSKTQFTAQYDGAPKFAAISGTGLSAAQNSPTPIIKAGEQSYLALDKGVWFTATSPTGPWSVATSVPTEIYSIPTSSPLHFVTYVSIYGSSGDEVYVGYTPGYYGTVASQGVVVYGTGYACDAWVGTYYYGCPTTYGYGATFAFGAAVGWGLAFGYGWYDPWYYPGWGPWYYPGYYPGYWGGAAFAYGNVYGRWGSTAIAGTRAAWANAWTGNVGQGFRGGYYNAATGGRGYGYAAHNTNVYTGRTSTVAGGIRYNPETGRVVAGRGGAAGNIYTGEGVAGGTRTTVNTNTGRVTRTAGGAARTEQGATVAGGGRTTGPGGNAAGAGYVHYDRDTGDISKGGVVDVNGNVFAGKDGNVYRYNDGSWNKVERPDAKGGGRTQGPVDTDRQRVDLDHDRTARDRGFERDSMAGRGFDRPGTQRPVFDRGSYGSGFGGRMGGFRGRPR